MQALIETIIPHQEHAGEFASTVSLPTGVLQDRNCFVTALVLRELSLLQNESCWQTSPEMSEITRRACGFLIRSTYPFHENLYSFYPHRHKPFWLQTALCADADDTAVIALELVRYGCKPIDTLHYIFEHYFDVYRARGVLGRHITKAWHREGVFLTWLTSEDIPNPIDCCVNTNVVAVLAAHDMKHCDGYVQAVSMIHDAVMWAGQDLHRLREITPYYPCPLEFYYAVSHAVTCGAEELLSTRDALSFLLQAWQEHTFSPQICSSVDGKIFWQAEVLYIIRRFNRSKEVLDYGRCH